MYLFTFTQFVSVKLTGQLVAVIHTHTGQLVAVTQTHNQESQCYGFTASRVSCTLLFMPMRLCLVRVLVCDLLELLVE